MDAMPEQFPEAYVVGAGFSRAFGLPAVGDLYENLLKECERDGCPKDCKDLPDLLDRFLAAFPALCKEGGKKKPDILELFTYIQIAIGPWGSHLPALRELQPDAINRQFRMFLCRMMHRKVREAEDSITDSGFFSNLPEWTVFVNLNWDNLVERALHLDGRQFVYEDAPYHHEAHRWLTFRERCFVFKPHGSIDWFIREPGKDRPLDTHFPLSYPVDPRTRVPNGYKIKEKHYLARWRSVESPGQADDWLSENAPDPLIVTLGHGKLSEQRSVPADHPAGDGEQDPFERLRRMYGQACDFLSRARRIAIIGYRLPPDDYEIVMLLQHALRKATEKNRVRPPVRVINPCAELQDRYESTLGGSVQFQARCFKPDDAVW